jgi:hypothetical protein
MKNFFFLNENLLCLNQLGNKIYKGFSINNLQPLRNKILLENYDSDMPCKSGCKESIIFDLKKSDSIPKKFIDSVRINTCALNIK